MYKSIFSLSFLIGCSLCVITLLNCKGDPVQTDHDLHDLIAFTKTDTVGTTIYTIKSDGSNLNTVYTFSITADPTNLRWAPDGSKIALNFFNGTLVVVGANGSNPIIFDQISIDHNFSWFPDSRHIAYSSDEDIYKIDIVKKTQQVIAEGSNPEVSPNGKQIAFLKDSELYSMNIAENQTTHLSDGVQGGLAWSPSGNLITFVTNDGSLWYVQSNGDKRKLLVNGGVVFRIPSWSPDEKRIAYWQDYGIGVVDIETLEDKVIIPNSWSPSWSPDGNYIAYSYIFSHTDNISVFTAKPDGSGTNRVAPIKTNGTVAWALVPIE